MAYEPTEWKTGDIVTSVRMNKIEAGIQNARMVIITLTKSADYEESYKMDADVSLTNREVADLLLDGTMVVVRYDLIVNTAVSTTPPNISPHFFYPAAVYHVNKTTTGNQSAASIRFASILPTGMTLSGDTFELTSEGWTHQPEPQ